MSEPVREVAVAGGLIALVDDSDFAHVSQFSWRAKTNASGGVYARAFIPPLGPRVARYMHQILTDWPLTDHINGDGLDNRRANLRPATQGQNRANSRMLSTNTTGYVGIAPSPTPGRWVARITTHGRCRYLGTFASREEAARAYDAALFEKHGEFARLNFPRRASA